MQIHTGRRGRRAAAARLVLVGALALAAAPAALAHAHLVAAVPAAGSSASQVAELRVTFSEPVEAKFSSLKLVDGADQAVAVPGLADAGDAKVLMLRLEHPLSPGRYRVDWSVLTADTHRSKGSFNFSVVR
jgi:methionine-rich copper-binding protein CopC